MSTPLLRTAAIRTLEAAALPHTPLMERAGLAAADYACEILSHEVHADRKTLVLAGSGNNGGDAYVCARHLQARGHQVYLVSSDIDAAQPADAAAAKAAWIKAGGLINSALPIGRDFDLAIDGLFGIGLARPIEGALAEWVHAFNQLACPRLALDLPSGLDADTGNILGCAVEATHTITFLADKPGLHTGHGRDHVGLIRCADLGIHAATTVSSGRLISAADFAALLQPRRHNTHKGSFGSAALVGGNNGMAGAALLAGRAALHLGAGRVYVGMLSPMLVDPLQPELMLRTPADAMAQASAIGIGAGMGEDTTAVAALKLAIQSDKPLALDADALNLLAVHPVLASRLTKRSAPTLLTPHPAEAARLQHCDTAEIQHDRIASAQALAKRFNATVLLKGSGSVVATTDGRWFINNTGNAGLATAGSGDVLLGMLTALLAQSQTMGHITGQDASSALLAAVHLHGAAADQLVAQGAGPVGLTAGELIAPARQIWNHWINTQLQDPSEPLHE